MTKKVKPAKKAKKPVDKKGKSGVKVLQNGKELSVREQDDKMIFDFNPYGGSIKISF